MLQHFTYYVCNVWVLKTVEKNRRSVTVAEKRYSVEIIGWNILRLEGGSKFKKSFCIVYAKKDECLFVRKKGNSKDLQIKKVCKTASG